MDGRRANREARRGEDRIGWMDPLLVCTYDTIRYIGIRRPVFVHACMRFKRPFSCCFSITCTPDAAPNLIRCSGPICDLC